MTRKNCVSSVGRAVAREALSALSMAKVEKCMFLCSKVLMNDGGADAMRCDAVCSIRLSKFGVEKIARVNTTSNVELICCLTAAGSRYICAWGAALPLYL